MSILVADVAARPYLCMAACRALGAGEDLKGFDVDNKWGKGALDRIYSDVLGTSDQMPGVQVSWLSPNTSSFQRS